MIIEVRKSSISKLKHVDRLTREAMIMTLNDTAMSAAVLQRLQLAKDFTLRNRWAKGSIYPKMGMRKGLALTTKKTLDGVYARTGSVQWFLSEQQMGFRRNNAEVPTKSARIGKNEKRRISKQNSLPVLRKMATATKKSFKKMRGKNYKGDQFLAWVNDRKKKFEGVIRVGGRGDGKNFLGVDMAPGYYKMVGRRGNRMLVMVRNLRQGNKKRYPKKWHTDALSNKIIEMRHQKHYVKNMNMMLRKIADVK